MKVALVVLLLCSAATGQGSSDRLADGALEFEDILPTNPRGYDKMAPPREVDKPTIVYFHVTVMSLDSIDESSMTYAADIFFAQSWKDWRLRLPDNMTQQYRLLPVQWLKDIWRPDSFFKNAKDVTFQEMTIPNHYIWLYQDKTILYMVKLTLVLSCAMNFEVYPHDTQECTMKIESLSHTTADLVFVWDPDVPLVVDQSIELPQLDLVRNVTGDCTQVYSTGNFTCLEIIFTFRRRLGYYLFHTYIPTCLIVIMSWISFWIRPEAVPARITLGVTSLLTLATQHANSQKSLPPVSYIKAIDVFMSSCMVFVFFSLMEYALVNVVLGDVPEEGRMPIICRTRRTNGHQSFHDGQRRSKSVECLHMRDQTISDDTTQRLEKSFGSAVLKRKQLSFASPLSTFSTAHVSGGTPISINTDTKSKLAMVPQHSQTLPRSATSSDCSLRGRSQLPTSNNKSTGAKPTVEQELLYQSSGPRRNSFSQVMVPGYLTFSGVEGTFNVNGRKNINQCKAEEIGLKNQRMSVPTHCGEHLGPCRNSSSYGCIGPGNNPPPGMVLGLPPPPPPPPAHLSPDGHDKYTQHDTEHETNNQRYEHPQQEEQQQLPVWSQVMERRRQRAILIDRVSRVFFPVSFTVLNIVYWGVFVIDWPPWEDNPIS